MFYKRMMNVLCEHCGKEIPGNSKFCRYCGQPVVPQPPIPSESNPSKLPLILAALVVCVVAVLGIRQMTGGAKPTATASAVSTPVAEVSSAPELSEYEINMKKLHLDIVYFSKYMISEELSNPESMSLTHDWNALTSQGVFITHCGTAKYLNRNGVQTEQPFKATMVINSDRSNAFFMALTLGDTVLYDECYRLDETGKIVDSNTTFGDRGYGEQAFDSFTNPDLWKKGPNDNGYVFPDNDGDLTLADYQAIEIGMSYDQVCKILGGPGVELSRAGSGKNETFSVTWSSPSVLGANISIMFKGGKVESKVQLGLQ